MFTDENGRHYPFGYLKVAPAIIPSVFVRLYKIIQINIILLLSIGLSSFRKTPPIQILPIEMF